jgi:hypothetical protein
MVFGEIVEPSTRALIDDDYEEYPDYVKPDLNWIGDVKVPSDLNTVIFVEGSKVLNLFRSLILASQKPYCNLESGSIQVYKLSNGKYIVTYIQKDITTGEIVEELVEWLKVAKNIYAVTCEPIAAYQNLDLSEKPENLIRVLSTENAGDVFNCKKLESPNLVLGLGAEVLSFSSHTGLKSTLFVVYMDNSPLDSINTHSVIQLMKSLDLPVKLAVSKLNPSPSNLYL